MTVQEMIERGATTFYVRTRTAKSYDRDDNGFHALNQTWDRYGPMSFLERRELKVACEDHYKRFMESRKKIPSKVL